MKTETAKAIVENYTERQWDTVQVHPDPKVPGTFAIRAMVCGKSRIVERGKVVQKAEPARQQDFLIIGWLPSMSTELAARLLEDCDFETWPPVSGKLKFL